MRNIYIKPILLLIICFKTFWINSSIKVFENLNGLKARSIDISQVKESDYSFHFLMPTIGRKSIFKILNSLKTQVKQQDYLTIIFDAKDVDSVLEEVKNFTKAFACHVNVIYEKENLGFWGHGIRNKYNTLQGDFILHCDDDNVYLPNSISTIRKICSDKSKLYIFKVKTFRNQIIWKVPKIIRRQIDTACGIIPTSYNQLSDWGYYHGADADFYLKLSSVVAPKDIIFVDYLIYSIDRVVNS